MNLQTQEVTIEAPQHKDDLEQSQDLSGAQLEAAQKADQEWQEQQRQRIHRKYALTERLMSPVYWFVRQYADWGWVLAAVMSLYLAFVQGLGQMFQKNLVGVLWLLGGTIGFVRNLYPEDVVRFLYYLLERLGRFVKRLIRCWYGVDENGDFTAR